MAPTFSGRRDQGMLLQHCYTTVPLHECCMLLKDSNARVGTRVCVDDQLEAVCGSFGMNEAASLFSQCKRSNNV